MSSIPCTGKLHEFLRHNDQCTFWKLRGRPEFSRAYAAYVGMVHVKGCHIYMLFKKVIYGAFLCNFEKGSQNQHF